MRSIEYTLKNNFLNQADYENIKNTILGEEFPWYFQYGVAVSKNIERASGEEEYLMGHTFFREHQGITSSFYKILYPILKKLKFKALIRIKANLYSNQGKIVEQLTTKLPKISTKMPFFKKKSPAAGYFELFTRKTVLRIFKSTACASKISSRE